MNHVLAKAKEFLSSIGIRSGSRRTGRISSVAQLGDFIASRAAFVSQKTLYGYVQTRMGMSYAKNFQDEVFLASLNIAKMHVFAACLSDLAIYAVAEALHGARVSHEACRAIARQCFRSAIEENMKFAPTERWVSDAISEFDMRLMDTIWEFGALKPENFTRSPRALVRWSPIAPELKKHDTEIVENSIKFAWLEVREEFRRRVDRQAIASEAGP
ncbi:MAG: hypothetical protein ABI705_03775 [Aestuariivirga sp.]